MNKPQYSIIVELDAPIEQCFEAAYREEAMMHWVAGPKSIVYDHSKAKEPYGPGSERCVTLQSGLSVIERVEVSERPNLFAYCIPSFGPMNAFMKNYRGRMNFEAIDGNRTRLTWNGYFDCVGLQKLGEPLVRIVLRKLVSDMASKIQRYLSAPHGTAAI